ncbi:hypothetical protein [Soonwooa sp.]|uniref:hypothetical protein n=1 Tax=Soonwooa sp. TaxID=1938592 RepID=UPI0026336DD4|nr:hypothetical protein [Soonwooa sp.]
MKTTFFKTALVFVICLLAFTSCRHNNNLNEDNPNQDNTTIKGKDIYILGYEGNADNRSESRLWKNGQLFDLKINLATTYINDIFVSGKDLYAVGTETLNQKSTVKLWKNGTLVYSSPSAVNTIGLQIFAANNSVYFTYYEKLADDIPRNKAFRLWKDGTITNLTDYVHSNSTCAGLFVNGPEVYIGLSEYYVPTNQMAAYIWKNGVKTQLTDGTRDVYLGDIYVSGNDVYATGREFYANRNGKAKLWKNGVETNLTDGAFDAAGYHVTTSGADVFISGFEKNANDDAIASVWKNGMVTKLSENRSYGTSIAIDRNDVYVVGTEYINNKGYAKLWKNGKPTNLTNGNFYAVAGKIIIVPQQ